MIRRSMLVFLVAMLVLAGAFFAWREQAVAPGEPGQTKYEANVIILSPRDGETIANNPITVTGKARVFERTFQYRLVDRDGKILFQDHGMTTAPDLPDYGNFAVKIPIPAGASKNLFVQVFEYSAKDGSIINQVEVPVVLGVQQISTVKAYFNNSKLDPQNTCTATFPVTRKILKSQEVGYLALTELLKGPSTNETQQSYVSSIPQGVQIKSFNIRDGIAYADFSEALEFEVGGSCRVAAIRSQITNTLKQFPTIKDVVISINGRTEDILQP